MEREESYADEQIVDYLVVSFVRRLLQSFMLITWLFSVRRSIKAAVSWSFLRKSVHLEKAKLDVIKVLFFL